MKYKLMHEDKELAEFKYSSSNAILKNMKLVNGNLDKLPLLELSSNKIEDRLVKWIIDRSIPTTRQNIKRDLTRLDSISVVDYMFDNLGLSLTDHYWFCPENKQYTWQEINLYNNDFKSTYSLDLSSDVKTIDGKTNFVPSASLKGDLKKKWIIDQYGIRRLVKGNTCRQSLCEILASEIHKRQGRFEYTPYSLIQISSDGNLITGCECPNFNTINTEFIPAIDIINSIKKSNNVNYYETYIKYCELHGINIREFMEYQILTDFIISNTDRHLNNFGMIRDSKTFELIKPAPIFDSGNSMFYNTNIIKVNYGLLNIGVISFKKHEIELLKYVTNPMLVNLYLLPSEIEVVNLFLMDESCNEEIAKKLGRAYKRKIEFVRELQGGIKIYSYNYLKEHNVKLTDGRN